MKTTLKKFIAILLLSVLGFASLPAQTNLPEAVELSAKDSAEIMKKKLEIEREITRTKLDIEKEITKTKLDIEKQLALNQQDAVKMMVHDLAWNSWVLFAIAAVFFAQLKARMRHETIRQMIEKGVPLSPELLQGLKGRSRLGARSSYDQHGYLFWGVILLAVGIGLLLVSGKVGWIVLLVGIAELILWNVDRNSQNNG